LATLREQRARTIALLTGILLVLLAVIFGVSQNPPKPPNVEVDKVALAPGAAPSLAETDASKQVLIAAGRRVFEAQGCMRCHAVAGEGNLRNPLDGVARRLTAEAIRQWILAPAELEDQLSSRAFQAKQAYRDLPADDMDALVIYLQSL
jgi:mono/diheme cytochrome c family protein